MEESRELEPIESVGPRLEERYEEPDEVVELVEKYLLWSFEGCRAKVGWR